MRVPVEAHDEPRMSYGSVPVPDPTRLTTDAVTAATTQFRRDIRSEMDIIGTRLDGMDKATDIRLAQYDRMPNDVALQIQHLERLHDEKFRSIELQFKERDIRTEQAAIAQKQALDAALLAAKELVGQQNTANVEAAAKSEASFTKQNDQTTVLIATLEKALTDRILEMKERIDRGEGSGQGRTIATEVQRADIVDRRSGQANLMMAVGLIVSVAAIIVTIILTRHA